MVQYYGKVVTLEERWDDIKPYAKFLLNKNDRVLDIGCAEGLLTDEIAKLVRFVDAVDIQEDYKWLAKEKNIRPIIGDILDDELNSYLSHFDVIFCLGILHKLSSSLDIINLLHKSFKAQPRVVFLRSTCSELLILDAAWLNGYSVFNKTSAFKNQGPIYICQKLNI